jgi:hypothetical protein
MEYRCYASTAFANEFLPAGLSLQSVLAAAAVLYNRKDSLHDEFLHSPTHSVLARIEDFRPLIRASKIPSTTALHSACRQAA